MIYIQGESEENNVIFADPSESRGLLEVEKQITFQYCPHLEEWTGADMLVTPLSGPFILPTMANHIKAGAIMIQVKRGSDLVSSVGERMNSSLARMRAMGAKPWQCMLLFVGDMHCDPNAQAIINNGRVEMESKHSYWSIQGAILRWEERGGTYAQIDRPILMPGWLMLLEAHVKNALKEGPKFVFDEQDALFDPPEENDPLQELIPVKDFRNTLITIPGLGPKKVQTFFEFLKATNDHPTLAEALYILLSWERIQFVPGFGKGIYESTRKWFGLNEGTHFMFVSEEDKKKLEEL